MLKYGAITYMYSVHCTLYGVRIYIYIAYTPIHAYSHIHIHTHIHIPTRTYTHNHGVLYNRFDVESTSESMNRK